MGGGDVNESSGSTLVRFYTDSSKEIVRILPNGNIVLGPDVTLDEASSAFWASVAEVPVALRAEIKRLQDLAHTLALSSVCPNCHSSYAIEHNGSLCIYAFHRLWEQAYDAGKERVE